MTIKSLEQMNADGSGGALLNYSVYRGDGKRAWKQSASGSRTYFFYDGDTLIATSGDAANSSSLLLWGADGLIGTQASNAVTSGVFRSSADMLLFGFWVALEKHSSSGCNSLHERPFFHPNLAASL